MSVLHRSHTLRGLRRDVAGARRVVGRRLQGAPPPPPPPPEPTPEELRQQRRAAQVERYLAEHDVAKLEIGSGNTVVDGWLGTDREPRHADVLQMDATRRFPLPDGSLDYVHAEHLIEHVSFRQGQRMLRQCRRVLRPGGVVRLATPDLQRLIGVYRGDAGPEGHAYLDWAATTYAAAPHKHAVFMLNRVMRMWGHQFVYDPEVLALALGDAGFVEVTRCEIGESAHEHLRGVERHHTKTRERDRAVRFETMVFEATSPGPPTG